MCAAGGSPAKALATTAGTPSHAQRYKNFVGMLKHPEVDEPFFGSALFHTHTESGIVGAGDEMRAPPPPPLLPEADETAEDMTAAEREAYASAAAIMEQCLESAREPATSASKKRPRAEERSCKLEWVFSAKSLSLQSYLGMPFRTLDETIVYLMFRNEVKVPTGMSKHQCIAAAFNRLVPGLRRLGHDVRFKNSHHVSSHEKLLETVTVGYIGICEAAGNLGKPYFELSRKLTAPLPDGAGPPRERINNDHRDRETKKSRSSSAKSLEPALLTERKQSVRESKCCPKCGAQLVAGKRGSNTVYSVAGADPDIIDAGMLHTEKFCPAKDNSENCPRHALPKAEFKAIVKSQVHKSRQMAKRRKTARLNEGGNEKGNEEGQEGVAADAVGEAELAFTLGRRTQPSRQPAGTQAATIAAHLKFTTLGQISASVAYFHEKPMHGVSAVDAQDLIVRPSNNVAHGTGLLVTQDVTEGATIFCAVMALFNNVEALENFESSMDDEGLYGSVIWQEGDPTGANGGAPLVEVEISNQQAKLQPTLMYYMNKGDRDTVNTHIVCTPRRSQKTSGHEVLFEVTAKSNIKSGRELLWPYARNCGEKNLLGFDDEVSGRNRREPTSDGGYCVWSSLLPDL